MRIAIGIDTRGDALRPMIREVVARLGHEVTEYGADNAPGTEYSEIAAAVARRIRNGDAERGILIGRTGMSMCIVANKFPTIRAAVCSDELMAEMSRRYLDVNVLCMSAELLSESEAGQIVGKWLESPFDGGRHSERVRRIADVEREAAAGVQEAAAH